MARVPTGRLCGMLPQGSPPPVPPMVGAVAAPSSGARVRHQVRRSGGGGAPSLACCGWWGLCWLCVGGSASGSLAKGNVRQGVCCHQRPGQGVGRPAYCRRAGVIGSRGWCGGRVLQLRFIGVFFCVVRLVHRFGWTSGSNHETWWRIGRVQVRAGRAQWGRVRRR